MEMMKTLTESRGNRPLEGYLVTLLPFSLFPVHHEGHSLVLLMFRLPQFSVSPLDSGTKGRELNKVSVTVS